MTLPDPDAPDDKNILSEYPPIAEIVIENPDVSSSELWDIAAEKQQCRRLGRARRADAARILPPEEAGRKVLSLMCDVGLMHRLARRVTAGFWPIGNEIDSRPVLHYVRERGGIAALPVTVGPDRPLEFRVWEPGERLVKGEFGEMTPGPEAVTMLPELLLVPLLAYDLEGYRLGYGGGYYDRTLEAMHQAGHRPVTIGLAWSAQECTLVPREPHDQSLDYIVTERSILSFEA